MVQKGLLVTLVLDCRFSGSVVRNGRWSALDIRFIDYDPHVDAASPQEHNATLSDGGCTLRNASVEKNWLVDPDSYMILSACGPHETALGLTTGGGRVEVDGGQIEARGERKEINYGERRGAFTYFLLDALNALRKSGVEITHHSLHEHLCASTKYAVDKITRTAKCFWVGFSLLRARYGKYLS